MCKLCNTDRPSLKYIRSETSLAIQEYIQEIPCKNCASAIRTTIREDGLSLDRAIIGRLYNSYKPYSGNLLGKAKRKNGMGERRASTKIPGIRILIYPSGTVSYLLTMSRKKAKVYKTIQQALDAKIEYMIENNQKKGLAQLKNKLKELTNENN